jgi:hypothetical protein
MANTFDTSRVGGGTYELAQDANGNYNLNSVGFTQVNKLNLPDLKTSDTSVADTTKKATEDTIKAQTTEVFKPANVYQSGGGGGENYSTMPTVKDATVRSAGSSMPQGSPGQLSKDKARAEANVELGLEPQAYKSPTMTTKENEFAQGKYTGVQTGLQKVQSAVQNTVGNVVDSVKNNKAVQMAGTVLGFAFNPVFAGAKMVAGMLPKDSPTDAFNRGYHPTNDTGRVSSNPSKDVFGGMNAVSGFGDIDKGAQNRVDNRNNVDKTGWSKEKTDRFDKTTKSFEKQIADKKEAKEAKDSKDKSDRTAAAAQESDTGMGSCFIAGTKVTMSDGTLKNIENIVVGDKVKGHKEDNTVIKLDPTLLADRKLYSFNNNEHYFFTSEHPFMTEEGWKSVKPEKTKERDGIELYNQLKGELKIGDKLVTEDGSIEITEIKSKEINNPDMPLYNFNVSNDNSYIADDYVVHNKGCFIKGTLITMLDGSKKPVEQVDLGDEVAEGGSVFAVGKFLNTELYDYKGIKVSGSHMVNEDGVWMRVKDTKDGKSLGNDLHTVYVFGSENRRILINGILFTDYFEVNEQDQLINNEKNFFNNWKSYGNTIDEHNVNTLNAS